ncbi:GBS Bsp-like repeat-containing protein [Streptococcus uberis]|uniref:GBS Bsp-like repeat-containing protein n=1 Tax=Streptococcus uberis TaxID=1349 RepID=UPI00193A8861|nr:GBS Bsp-like repeat-containing protein [Streptococcus uberis]MCK1207333.1 GBS Bsp-like repeat-containing protein [Streptococcus uberis]MCZ8466570.1 GBS Bsp-like repeat-containing protein [Streptococcus uberis]
MRKKMYKSKKHWVVASVVGLSFLGATTVAADTANVSMDASPMAQTPYSDNSLTATSQTISDASLKNKELANQGNGFDINSVVTSSEDDTTTKSSDTTSVSLTNTVSEETISSENENTINKTESSQINQNGPALVTSQTLKKEQPVPLEATQVTLASVASTPVTTASISGKTLFIQYNGDYTPTDNLKFAVWSDGNGQDDLVWYSADATAAAYVDLSKHKSLGLYHVHTYNKYGGLNAMTVTVPSPEVVTEVVKKSPTIFDILVKNVPDVITSLQVPVWSEVNGQDDIKWYDAIKQVDNTYLVTVNTLNHKSSTGIYKAHIYGYNVITQSRIGLSSNTSFNVEVAKNATVSIINYAEKKSSFDVVVAGNSETKQIMDVSIAAWSETNGQDDLKWYKPVIVNNQSTQKIDISNLSNKSDNYVVHVYTTYSDGSKVGTNLGSYKITLGETPEVIPPQPVASDIKATLTSEGIVLAIETSDFIPDNNLRYAVWSNENSQDDLKWYEADASGKALARYENHKDFGDYNIHVYRLVNGQMQGVSTTKLNIPAPSVSSIVRQTSPSKYEIIISNVPKYMASISVPVWSVVGGQNDIEWLTATKITVDSYKATVRLDKHQFDLGDYSAHIYGKSKIGNTTLGLGVTQGFTLEAQSNVYQNQVSNVVDYIIQNHRPKDGRLEIVVNQKSVTNPLKQVKLVVWSEDNQSNQFIYDYSKLVNGSTLFTVSQLNHSSLKGNYTIKAIVDFQDGTSNQVTLGQFVLNGNMTTPYFNQLDPRWAYRQYGMYSLGASGCAPTTLSMIFSSLSGKTILPPQVADYLYTNTNEFDKNFIGTSAQGILAAVKGFGYQALNLGSLNALTLALQGGYHVAGAVQNNKFVPVGSHEMVFRGYYNGYTYVYDPYTQSYCGWYPVANLWNERSFDKDDNRGVSAPFFRISNI